MGGFKALGVSNGPSQPNASGYSGDQRSTTAPRDE